MYFNTNKYVNYFIKNKILQFIINKFYITFRYF